MAFITGTTGLLGSHLALHLLKQGEEVYALKRPQSNLNSIQEIFSFYKAKELFNKIQWLEGDIMDLFLMDEIIKDNKEVYHTAAFVSFNKKDHQKILDININGTHNIIEACIKNNARLVYTSSIASLGRGIINKKTTETDYRDSSYKSSVYSMSKFIAEQEVWRGIAEGLNAVIINPSVILGPGDWTKSSTQLFKTVHQGLRFYTQGSNGYVDVRDVAEIMFRLMHSDIRYERFVLSSENVSYKDLFEMMAKSLQVKAPDILASKWVSEIAWRLLAIWSMFSGKSPLITKETSDSANSYYQYSSQKIKAQLGYTFIPIMDSINNAAKAYLLSNSKQ